MSRDECGYICGTEGGFYLGAAGPIVTKQLADNGATVLKVESIHHRQRSPGWSFTDDKPGIIKSFFADFNSSKLSLAVNMGYRRAAGSSIR